MREPVVYAIDLSTSSRVWRLFFDQLSTGVTSEELFRSLNLKRPLRLKLLVNSWSSQDYWKRLVVATG